MVPNDSISHSESGKDSIAVIGMALRLPGAGNPDAYWQLLIEGQHGVQEIPPARWNNAHLYDPNFKKPGKTVSRHAGLIDSIDAFDAAFFGISPREAHSLDPQQRLMLETTWHALEDAGLPLSDIPSDRMGVYAATMANDYHQHTASPFHVPDAFSATGTYAAFLANRISHHFGWRGESVTVDTACASSLTALHLARHALLRESIDCCIVGGVNVLISPWRSVAFSHAGMLSPQGFCKAFSDQADGYVPGEGIVVLVLKRTRDAIKSGDRILGLMHGSAINHMGETPTLTSPSVKAESTLIRRALEEAGIDPSLISYVECHGTGTPLGDPIEVEALAQVLSSQRVLIGSVKSNLGHLEAAAGLAGVAKVLLMLRHRMIPPTLHIQHNNPLIDFDHLNLSPAKSLCPWDFSPRLAGVSAYGFGGGGGHVILGEAPISAPLRSMPALSKDPSDAVSLAISASDPHALHAVYQRLAEHLESHPHLDLKSVGRALRQQRTSLQYRRQIQVKGREEAIRHLRAAVMTSLIPDSLNDAGLELRLQEGRSALDWSEQRRQIPGLDRIALALEAKLTSAGFQIRDTELTLHIQARSWLALLEDCGIRPAQVTVYGRLRPAAMAAAGMLDEPAAAQMACQGSLQKHQLRRPNYRYLDGSHGIQVPPVLPPAESLRLLRPEPQMTRILLELGQRLWRSHHAFRALLNEAQRHFEVEIEELLSTPMSEDAGLALACAVALWKIADRWSIRVPQLATQWAGWPLAGWIGEQWVEMELGLAILRGHRSFEVLREPLSRIARQPDDLRHPWLFSQRSYLAESATLMAPMIGDRPSGLRIYPTVTETWFKADFNPTQGPVIKPSEGIFGLEKILTLLWSQGTDVKFSALGLERPNLELPLYPFQRKSYWLPRLPNDSSSTLWESGTQIRITPPVEEPSMPPEHSPHPEWLALIRQCVAETLESRVEDIDPDAPLSRQGIDSLISMELASRIDQRTGVKLSPSIIEQIDHVRGLAERIAKETAPSPVEPVTGQRPELPPAHHWVAHLESPGILSSLKFIKVSQAPLEADQVRVKVSAAGLNFRDLMVALDALPQAKGDPLGLEFCGEIIEVGTQVTHRMPGQRVFGVGFGAFADSIVVSADQVYPAPTGFSDAVCAALPIAYLTALRCLQDLEPLRPGMRVLIHSATGGLGQAALRLCLHHDVQIFATAGTLEKRNWLLTQGVQAAFDSRSPDFGNRIRLLTGGHGVDLILNSLTGALLDTGLACLSLDGVMIDVGKTDLRDAHAISMQFPGRRYRRYDLVEEMRHERGIIGDRLAELAQKVATATLPPLPVETFALKDAAKALQAMARAQHWGKLVLIGDHADEMPEAAPPKSSLSSRSQGAQDDVAVAIIGFAGRFPGAANSQDFWLGLRLGHVMTSHVPEGRWSPDEMRIFSAQVSDPALITRGGFMPDVDAFDSAWFGFSPREARVTDPRQRVLLTEVWKALAAAGYEWQGAGNSLSSSDIGFFVAADAADYGFKRTLAGLKGDQLALAGNLPSSLAARLAHCFGTQGPAMTIDMSCASSFGALWAAQQALSEGRCNVAVVAGVSLHATPMLMAQLASAGLVSASGQTRSFAHHADGMVPAEACLALVLKPLNLAIVDNNPIYGVIRGLDVAHDGKGQGFNLPESHRLASLYQGSLEKAGLTAEDIDLIAVHGVGTRGGDTAELTALRQVFADIRKPCPITSAKPLIGHTLAASGLTAILHVILQFRHQSLLASGMESQHLIDEWDPTRFQLTLKAEDWAVRSDAGPHRALVNGFAINGGMGSAIIEDAPSSHRPTTPIPPEPDHSLNPRRYWVEPPEPSRSEPAPEPSLAEVYEGLRLELAEVLQETTEDLAWDAPPQVLGLSSILAIELQHRLQLRFGVTVRLEHILGVSRVDEIVTHLVQGTPDSEVEIQVQAIDDAPHEPFPLTHLQAAYWSGRQTGIPLGGTDCQVHWSFQCAKPWPLERLEQAWNRLVRTHPMLRAVIDASGQQKILKEVPYYAFEIHDLPATSAISGGTEAISARMASVEISPEQWPLFRIGACHSNDQVHLFVTFNLMAIDVLSLYQLLDEWAQLSDQPDAEFRAPKLSFRQCVMAAVQSRDRDAWRLSEQFWRERGPCLPPSPDLPMVQPLAQLGVLRTHRLQYRLNAQASSELIQRARDLGYSPSEVMLSLFAGVLSHWTRSAHFTLNLTTHNRAPLHPDVNRVIGNFTDTVLIDVDAQHDLPFTALLQRVSQRLRAHLEHTHYSGILVMRQRIAQNGLEAGIMPVVFTSMLGYEALRTPHAGAEMTSIGTLVHGATRTPQVTLDAQVQMDQGELLMSWDVAEGVFPPDLPEAMFLAWTTLAAELASSAAWDLAPAAWIRARETEVRKKANADRGPIPDEPLFAPLLRQAERHPDRVALIDGSKTLTYGMLQAHCEALASRLQAQGLPRQSLIGVAMHKGWKQVVTAIAVQMAGGAYLPLTPDLPPYRFRQLAEQAGIQRAIMEPGLSLDWPDGIEVLEATSENLTSEAPYRSVSVASDDLAYVIFTSGSTGDPKGVMMTHRAALNTCLDINRRFAMGPHDRVLGLSSLSFDLSVWDIFGVLGAGGAVVLPKAESANDPDHLAGCIQTQGITVWNSVPMYLELLLAGDPSEQALSSLRCVMLSGDWIATGLADRLRARAPNVSIHSLGGATEAGIWSIHYPIPHKSLAHWQSVPYGQAMDNQTFDVFDPMLRPCPDSVTGDLYIGGIGLSLGYLGDTRRTQQAFITHPETGERLYRTGDLGRWRSGGLIEFLGRQDGQVKIDGFRVELGEVEAALRKHPDVHEAVAVAPEDDQHRRRLAAFVTLEHAVTAAELTAFVRERLPSYMVPRQITILESFPLNENEKVDRRALSACAVQPTEESLNVHAERADPKELEQQLIRLWAQIIGESVRLSDLPDPSRNLFELGADSLMAVKASRRITQEIGIPCSVTDIFSDATIARLALALANRKADSKVPANPPRVAVLSAADRRRNFRSQVM